ncbi:unnamed protein product [Durusdinium trenchii]|uniref:Secreted protein n=1 Tax=Durusdinium trenchii TaxID=1381693 RepID=A0ABP0IAX9_9DINO
MVGPTVLVVHLWGVIVPVSSTCAPLRPDFRKFETWTVSGHNCQFHSLATAAQVLGSSS